MAKYLDKSGVTYLWNKIKGLFTDQSLNTKNKTYAGAINEINTKVGNLTGAFLWKGKFDTLPAVTNYEAGNVVGVGKKEYVLTVTRGTKTWEEFGDEGSYLLKTAAEETYLKKAAGEVKTANLADKAVTENKLNDDLRSKVNDNVKTITQTLTDTQKAQARQNLDVLEVTQQDIDNLPGGGLNPISDNTTPEVQKIETLLGFDVNGNVSKTKTIDADHLATGSVTTIKIGEGNIVYQHLDEGLKATIRYHNGLIICNLDTSIPSEWWYVIEVTENPPVQDLYPIHYIDEYGNIFSLEKVLAGEDDNQKILQFTSLYSDSEPSDVIDLNSTYISATRVTVNAPEGDECKISISTGEEVVSESVNNIVTDKIDAVKPFYIDTALSPAPLVTLDAFWEVFSYDKAYDMLSINRSVYIKISNRMLPVTTAKMSKYTDNNNFTAFLYYDNAQYVGDVNCSIRYMQITASGGKVETRMDSALVENPLIKLVSPSGSLFKVFAMYNSGYIPGAVFDYDTIPLSGGCMYLLGPSGNNIKIWMKLPWISEAQHTKLKAALLEKFPDADAENIKQVYKECTRTPQDLIAIGDSIEGYTAIVAGVSLVGLKLYFL